MYYKVRKFTESLNFIGALKVAVAAVVPLAVGGALGYFDIGFTIALGAFLTFPSDISSNLRHKISGILAGAVVVAASAFIVSVAYPIPIVFYPVFASMVFALSMISVYGHRATLVSFSGLLSISLVFSDIYQGTQLLYHCGLMLLGGLFYLVVSLAFYKIRPQRYAELQLAECMRLTAKYLKLRGDLWSADANREKIIEKQLHLQVELNAIHENIRETLIRSRTNSGSSNQNRKMLIAFISLVEILELALSTAFDHKQLREKFSNHDAIDTYQHLAYNLASLLKKLSISVETRKKYISRHRLLKDVAALERSIYEYQKTGGSADGVYMLTTMLHYAEKQVEKIHVVERAFTLDVFRHELRGADKDLEKFLTPQYYPLSTLIENISFSSAYFRHSLRLTLTILAGFVIGKMLPFQHVYWILLTIVVIMRPGYGLTKERSYQRIFGTVLGGVIAFGILALVNDTVAVSIFAVVAMILGIAFSQIDYKVGATFVTMYVVFLYGMMTPNIADVVQYRILDTVVGAGLAFIANYLLWPSWEFLNIPKHLEKSIIANQKYLSEISRLYNTKSDVTVPYRLARKGAFIEIGNLMASFQRMLQEPKSKQKNVRLVYKLAVLNHSLLSSEAALGTYIQSHRTTKASEAFNAIVNTAILNLENSIKVLNGNTYDGPRIDIARRFTELRNIRAGELADPDQNAEAFHEKMQEAQLVIEQLLWLTNLTESILKSVSTLKNANHQE